MKAKLIAVLSQHPLKHTKQTLPLLATLLLTACGSPRVWYKEGATQQQIRQDLAKCRMEASRIGTSIGGYNAGSYIASAMADGGRKKEFVRECMFSQGYSLTKESALPPGETGVKE